MLKNQGIIDVSRQQKCRTAGSERNRESRLDERSQSVLHSLASHGGQRPCKRRDLHVCCIDRLKPQPVAVTEVWTNNVSLTLGARRWSWIPRYFASTRIDRQGIGSFVLIRHIGQIQIAPTLAWAFDCYEMRCHERTRIIGLISLTSLGPLVSSVSAFIWH